MSEPLDDLDRWRGRRRILYGRSAAALIVIGLVGWFLYNLWRGE